MTAEETISTPTVPSGSAAGTVGTSYSYSTRRAFSSAGNAVSYLFDWGDGQTSGWLPAGATSASHAWASSGSFIVTAVAADAGALLIRSSPSSGLTVRMTPPPPTITSLSPQSAVAGAPVTISGSNFGSTRGTGSVFLGSTIGAVISWGDTQIIATVASNAMSGRVQVQQGGVWSNSMPFTIATSTISGLSADHGAPGDPVTIAGSNFGATQGAGQVWLGTASAVVQSWGDTQIVALVGAGSTTGKAQVLHNGVMSNAVPFTLDILQIASISPGSGVAGDPVTFTGTGFGASQSGGAVVIGNAAATATSWTDTEVIATVPGDAKSGVAKIQQNGAWSNAKNFTILGGNTVVPGVLNMAVGDTRTLQALTATGLPASGLTWTSSDSTVVSLSTDDPPVLTAVAIGNVTITAGTGSADVTVTAGGLAPGTVIWSNPGSPAGVTRIVPAVPSPSGVADVFAFGNDGTVQAITSEGVTAWTADVSDTGWNLPDFQGGLVVADGNGIRQLDGTTGQAHSVYPLDPQNSSLSLGSFGNGAPPVAVHTDGTIFALIFSLPNYPYAPLVESVIGLDPTTGTQKFSVGIPDSDGGRSGSWPNGMMIAGDGYAYVAYTAIHYAEYSQFSGYSLGTAYKSLMVLRIDSSGAHDLIDVYDWEAPPIGEFFTDGQPAQNVHMITNADTGILITWQPGDFNGANIPGMALITGTSATVLNTGPVVPGQMRNVNPVLQAQDGSFIGTIDTDEGGSIAGFDVTGNVRWSVPGDNMPQIATADGGFIAQAWDSGTQDYTGPATTFDANGNATGQINLLTQSWTGNCYQYGSVEQLMGFQYVLATSYWAFAGGTASENYTAAEPLPDRVKAVYDGVGPDPLGAGAVLRNVTYRLFQGIHTFAPSRNAVIREVLDYKSGQKPKAGYADPGKDFDDIVGTSGKGPFIETQQFTVTLPGYRPYPVQIQPCIRTNEWGKPVKDNKNTLNVTSNKVLINDDPGSSEARICRP